MHHIIKTPNHSTTDYEVVKHGVPALIKSANVSDLSQAYRFLKRLKWFDPKEVEKKDGTDKRKFLTLSFDIYQEEIIMTAVEKAKELLGTDSNTRAFEIIANCCVL